MHPPNEGLIKGKRAMATPQRMPASEKPASKAPSMARDNQSQPTKPMRESHVEHQDWHGEGVVSTNHTD